MAAGSLGHSFPRTERLQKRADFLRIQSSARRVEMPHFVLLVARQIAGAPAESPNGPVRLGIVVTRKIGNAVVRNRIKRLCRECFRRHAGVLPEGVDLVMIARRGAEGLGLEGVEREWKRAQSQLVRCFQEALAQPPRRTHASGA